MNYMKRFRRSVGYSLVRIANKWLFSSQNKRPITWSRARLQVEMLEDRLAPATLSTISGGMVVIGGGGTLTDSALLSGGASPTGTLTFTLRGPTNTVVNTQTVSVNGNGTYNTPSGFLPSAVGTYQWVASYGGDSNNGPVSTNLGDEPEVVTSASPSISTTPGPTEVVGNGQRLTDSATLSGGFNPTGTLTFTLYAVIANYTVVDQETVQVSGNGNYFTPTGYLPSAAGNYQWVVTYSGDGNNNPIGGLNTTPTNTLGGFSGPDQLAIDGNGNLFVADYSNQVLVFPPGSTNPSRLLPVSGPNGVAVDRNGNAFVSSGSTVLEFAPGSTTPTATLTGLNQPGALAVDPSGDLFVLNTGNNTVSEFLPGGTTPTATLTGVNQPYGLAFDASGDLFVSNVGNDTISEFLPGGTTPTATLTGVNQPLALAFDASGDLFVSNLGNNTVSEFLPGGTMPTATLTGLVGPNALAFDPSGDLFVSNTRGSTVSEFAPGSTVPTTTFTGLSGPPFGGPRGLAIDARGDLFISEGNPNSVQEYTPTTEAETVVPASPIIRTTAGGSVLLGTGGRLTDSATLTGGFNPIGSITFTLYAPNNTAVDTETVSVNGDGTYSTPSGYSPSTPGVYQWVASYSGDGNNNPVSSTLGSEPEAVFSPGITTTDGGTVAIGSGAKLNDTALLQEPTSPTGTITFTLYGPTNTVVDTETVTVTGNGVYNTPSGYLPTMAGTYQWVASYGGDSNNGPVSTNLGDEPEVVTSASPSISTTPGPTEVVGNGQKLTDSATLSGGFNPTGTLTFSLYDLTTNYTVVDQETVQVSGNGTYTAPNGYLPNSVGNFQWVVTYSGDGNNNPIGGLNTTPTNTLGGFSGPDQLAIDGNGNLFVADYSNQVLVFPPGSTNPSRLLPVSGPNGVAVDRNGNAFVSSGSTVLEFAPGSTTPTATLTGLNQPGALAVDPSGDLFVLNTGNNTVSEFLPGGTTPTATLTGVNQPYGLAFDASGDLFVSNVGNDTISEFLPGGTTPTATLTGVNQPLALAFDASGDLFVSNLGNNTVSEFLPGGTMPTATLTGLVGPNALAFDPSGDLFVSNTRGSTVSEFAPGSTVPTTTFTGLSGPPFGGPRGLAIDARGDLFISEGNPNSVQEYTPTTEAETVVPASPIIRTTAGGSVLLGTGGMLTDSATLTGGFNPIGSITFTLYAPNNTAVDTETVSVNGDGTYSTPSGYSPSTPGVYQWVASYSGDGNNNPVSSTLGSEPEAVFSPGITTTDGGTVAIGSGAKLNDTALLQEPTSPTGTITFTLYGPTNTVVDTETVTVTGNGVYNTPSGYLPTMAGTYQWVASYGGDSNNGPVSTNLGDEPEVVTSASPSISTTPGPTEVVGNGQKLTDSATLSGGFNPTGTLTFSLYDLTTNYTVVDQETVQVSGNGTYTAPNGYLPNSVGNFQWVVTYSGDGNNNPIGGLNTTPTNTLGGFSGPDQLAIDGNGNLFVADYSNQVLVFPPGSTNPSRLLPVSGPNGVAVDRNGNAFVSSGSTVLEFAPGSTTPTATLTGLNQPGALAVDPSGDLFVLNTGNNTVSEFLPGGTTPTATLTGVNQPYGLAFDASGDLFVSNVGNDTISEFLPGGTTPTATLTGVNQPLALAFDASGDLFVSNLGNNTVSEFLPGGTMPTATLTGLVGPNALAFDPSGDLFVSNTRGSTVSEFAPGSTVPTTTFTGLSGPPFGGPRGLAIDARGDLFISEGNPNSVQEYTPTTEAETVVPASPIITTTAGGTSAALTDSATLSGGFNPTGILTFTLYGSDNAVLFTATVPVNGNGTYNTPSAFAHVGTYQWGASYSGDVNNNPAAAQGTFINPFPINPFFTQPEIVTANQVLFARVTLPAEGNLTASVLSASGQTTRLTLLNSDGSVLLASSDGQVGSTTDLINQLLPPGNYLLAVQGLTGMGMVTLSTSFTPGNGNSTFQQPPILTGVLGLSVAADFGNGHVDLVGPASGANAVSVEIGNGDGTFQAPVLYPVGTSPDALVVGDFNGDGRPDVAVANAGSNNVTILLGDGDGTFKVGQTFAVGGSPTAIVEEDLGNGQQDLITLGSNSNTVSVLLGNGNGTFQQAVNYSVGTDPVAMVVGNFGNGALDIATADSLSNTVSVLLGDGQGHFGTAQTYQVGNHPDSLVAADLGNGQLDLATANEASNTVSILMNKNDGTGTFLQPAQTYQVGNNPLQIVAADLGNGHPDLITSNGKSNLNVTGGTGVTVLVGDGKGNFVREDISDGLTSDGPIQVAKLGNGHDDVITTAGQNTVQVYLGLGVLPVDYQVGPNPDALVAADLGNGQIDVLTWNGDATVSVFLGKGTGAFVPVSVSNPQQATPLLTDFTGNGIVDAIVVGSAGNILYRAGVSGDTGAFVGPIIVNPNNPAREAAILSTSAGNLIAALDIHSNAVSLYQLGSNGTFSLVNTLPVGTIATRIMAGDLAPNSTGPADDLVVLNSGDGSVSVFLADGNGSFKVQTYQVGLGASGLALAPDPETGVPDIVLSNQLTGEITVLANNGLGSFTVNQFRGGSGPYGFNGQVVQSLEDTVGLVTGDFSGTTPDVLALNAGADSVGLLAGQGAGSFLNPVVTGGLGSGDSVIVAGEFDKVNNAYLDFAVLNEATDTISVYLDNGNGTFTLDTNVDGKGNSFLNAGNDPTGVSVFDVNNNGNPDLVVGNSFGDVLILLGDGDGTFQPYQRVDQGVSLAIVNQNGQDQVILGNEAQDRVSVQDPQGANNVLLTRFNGLLGPNVQLADVNHDGNSDLIVLNSGSNSVDVFLGQPGGVIDLTSKQSFFVGDNPSSVLVADVNNDSIPDLVVTNAGSNDVSILFGTGTTNLDGSISNWFTKPGPRLKVDSGPNSVLFATIPAGGTVPAAQYLMVSNQQSNNLWMLPSVGQGFFNDTGPIIIPNLSGAFLSAGAGAFLVNPLSGAVSFVPDLADPMAHLTIPGLNGLSGVGGDFNGDGTTDALVLQDDGTVDLILGNTDGVTIAASLSTGVKDSSEIALSPQQSDVFSFYVSYVNSQDIEAAQLFAFNLDSLSQNVTGAVVDVVPLDNSSLAFIAVIATGISQPPSEATAAIVEAGPLTDVLLGLADTGLGGDRSAMSGGFAQLEDRLRQGLVYVGDRLTNDTAVLSQALSNALQEIGSALDGGLGGDDPETAHLAWQHLLGQSFTPLQQVSQHSSQLIGEAIKHLARSSVGALRLPFGQPQSRFLPTDGAEPKALPLDQYLGLSVFEGDIVSDGWMQAGSSADDQAPAPLVAPLMPTALRADPPPERSWLWLTAPVLAAFWASERWSDGRSTQDESRKRDQRQGD